MQDNNGVILATTTKLIEPTSVDIEEAEVARYGLIIAKRFCFNSIILEGDSTSTWSLVNTHKNFFSPIFVITEDIHTTVSSLSNILLVH